MGPHVINYTNVYIIVLIFIFVKSTGLKYLQKAGIEKSIYLYEKGHICIEGGIQKYAFKKREHLWIKYLSKSMVT